jgi:hypothetical protein
MLFRDIFAPYPDNYTKHITTMCEENGDFMLVDHSGKLKTKKCDVTQKPILNSFHSSIAIGAAWPVCS